MFWRSVESVRETQRLSRTFCLRKNTLQDFRKDHYPKSHLPEKYLLGAIQLKRFCTSKTNRHCIKETRELQLLCQLYFP